MAALLEPRSKSSNMTMFGPVLPKPLPVIVIVDPPPVLPLVLLMDGAALAMPAQTVASRGVRTIRARGIRRAECVVVK
jgi:hypothetical protein